MSQHKSASFSASCLYIVTHLEDFGGNSTLHLRYGSSGTKSNEAADDRQCLGLKIRSKHELVKVDFLRGQSPKCLVIKEWKMQRIPYNVHTPSESDQYASEQ